MQAIHVIYTGKANEYLNSTSMLWKNQHSSYDTECQQHSQNFEMVIIKYLIRPVFQYACVAWCPHKEHQINLLEFIPRKATSFL